MNREKSCPRTAATATKLTAKETEAQDAKVWRTFIVTPQQLSESRNSRVS
jgi:hypothetical protein